MPKPVPRVPQTRPIRRHSGPGRRVSPLVLAAALLLVALALAL